MDFTDIDAKLDSWIDRHADEMIREAQELIRIPSVAGPEEPGAPFGRETRNALDYVAALSGRYGLAVKMLDGKAMHAEMGAGDFLIGVLAHADVVPAGEDWTYPPFGAVVENGKLIGRGALDDKGPLIAGLFAMFAVKETGAPVNARIRAIVGADEESGFRCVEHYFNNEQMPDIGFTPDGAFPAIYAEKGIATPVLVSVLPRTGDSVQLVELSAGARTNMVPARASAKLKVSGTDLDDASSKISGDNISVEKIDGGLVVRAVGVSAHASYPQEGVNAVALLAVALLKSGLLPGAKGWLETLRGFAADNTGEVLGICGSDEVSGYLTSNLGVVTMDGESVSAGFSVRYPVTWKGNDVKSRIEKKCENSAFSLGGWKDSPPLYVPIDDPLLETLLSVYRSETGDLNSPKTMGGGTYARSMKKAVAFGPNFPGFPDVAHKADEFWYVDDLIKSARIYAKALVRLAVR